MTDSRTLDELARDNSLANNDEGASGEEEEEEEGNEGTNDGDYSEENEEEGKKVTIGGDGVVSVGIEGMFQKPFDDIA
ncbi:hypothetical protein Tco_1083218 [Tanacetum coccineum]